MRQFPLAAWWGATAALMAAPTPSQPPLRWGVDGHRIVATVALERLSPAVASETRRLLGGQSIVDVAAWADEVRRQLPNTGPWHFINLGITDSSYVPSRDCKQDACVIAAVASQLAILADRSRPDSARATALKFVVHFIGDLHQPLHSGERGDRGGNDVKVTFQGKITNLHSLWDSGLLLSFGETDAAIVRRLDEQIARRNDIARIGSGTVVSWVVESHDVSRDFVYRRLPNSLEITAEYADAARPVIDERLLRGGVRLAAVLERALGGAK